MTGFKNKASLSMDEKKGQMRQSTGYGMKQQGNTNDDKSMTPYARRRKQLQIQQQLAKRKQGPVQMGSLLTIVSHNSGSNSNINSSAMQSMEGSLNKLECTNVNIPETANSSSNQKRFMGMTSDAIMNTYNSPEEEFRALDIYSQEYQEMNSNRIRKSRGSLPTDYRRQHDYSNTMTMDLSVLNDTNNNWAFSNGKSPLNQLHESNYEEVGRECLENKLKNDLNLSPGAYQITLEFGEGSDRGDSESQIQDTPNISKLQLGPTMPNSRLGVDIDTNQRQSIIEQVQAEVRKKNNEMRQKQKAEQDWRLVKQTLYELDFSQKEEEKALLESIEARVNSMDNTALRTHNAGSFIVNRPSLALGKTFFSLANMTRKKQQDEERKKLLRLGAYDNNPVIAPTVHTLNKQALFKKRQERQDRNNMLDAHLQGVSVNTASNNQLQPQQSESKQSMKKIPIEVDSRNSLIDKTNDSIVTDKLIEVPQKPAKTKQKNLASWELAATNGEDCKELWCTSPQDGSLERKNSQRSSMNVSAVDLLKYAHNKSHGKTGNTNSSLQTLEPSIRNSPNNRKIATVNNQLTDMYNNPAFQAQNQQYMNYLQHANQKNMKATGTGKRRENLSINSTKSIGKERRVKLIEKGSQIKAQFNRTVNQLTRDETEILLSQKMGAMEASLNIQTKELGTRTQRERGGNDQVETNKSQIDQMGKTATNFKSNAVGFGETKKKRYEKTGKSAIRPSKNKQKDSLELLKECKMSKGRQSLQSGSSGLPVMFTIKTQQPSNQSMLTHVTIEAHKPQPARRAIPIITDQPLFEMHKQSLNSIQQRIQDFNSTGSSFNSLYNSSPGRKRSFQPRFKDALPILRPKQVSQFMPSSQVKYHNIGSQNPDYIYNQMQFVQKMYDKQVYQHIRPVDLNNLNKRQVMQSLCQWIQNTNELNQ